MSEKLTLVEIETAYIQAAKIVHRYGDVYLPIFERLEMERETYIKAEEMLTRAKRIAMTNSIE
ncbi:MAG: hypothetical protein K6L75_08510 [Cellvibrionaceae bacterium]|jgi:hypothetical protein